MINVLYAVIRGEMGGVERFLDSVLSAHSDRVRPVVLSFRDGPWLDELRARGVPVYVIENARLREPMRCFREVRAIIRRHQIDVVHSSYSWCHSLTWPAAFYSGCRTVWFHHGPVGEGRWQGAMALIPADLMLTNSDFMLERLKTTIHSARRLGVVHYGVEAIAWSETYAKYEAIIMGDEPVVARGKLDVDDERAQIILEGLTPLDSALLDSIREVRITADEPPRKRRPRRIENNTRPLPRQINDLPARQLCRRPRGSNAPRRHLPRDPNKFVHHRTGTNPPAGLR